MKKSIKTKIGTLLLIVALVVTMVPTTLFADGEGATEYALYVAGVQVTSENANDVLSDGGSVKYDSTANKLTLTDANISIETVEYREGARYGFGILDNTDSDNLVIEAKGKNKMYSHTFCDYGYGIFAKEDKTVILCGDGELDINISRSCANGFGIYTLDTTDVVTEGSVDINIFSSWRGIETNNFSVLENSQLKIDSESDSVRLGRHSSIEGGSMIMDETAIFEAYAAVDDGTAFYIINTKGGNIESVGAFVGQSPADVEGAPWTGDTDQRKLEDYKFVRFPYEANPRVTIYFGAGDYGEGSMDSISLFRGGSFKLPECDFTGVDFYKFDGWMIDGVKYRPGDRVTINADTVVTATWLRAPLGLFIGGVSVNSENASDVFGDGTVSVAQAEAPGGRPGLLQITLNNATIECDRLMDGTDPGKEYGILNDIDGKYTLEIVLKGKNTIINKTSYAGIYGVEGIVTNKADETTFKGDGTLDVEIPAPRVDGEYTGIHTLQQTNITNTKVNVCLVGEYYISNKSDTKAFYLEGEDQVSLSNNAELSLDSIYSYAFDNNSQTNADIDVEKGSKFQAKCKWLRTWGALHGNGWVVFSDNTKAQGVMVSQLYSGDESEPWDETTDIGKYKFVRIHNDKPEPETTTVAPVKPTVKPTVKPAVKAPAKAKVKKAVKKKKSSKKIKITLKKTKGAKGYQVAAYKKKKDAKKNKKALKKKYVKKVKFTLTSKKFKKKKKLYVRARAYVLDGKAKVFGKWSKIKKVKTK